MSLTGPVSRPCDIAIVGGGAAGLAAAIAAAEETAGGGSARIEILDGAARLGAKILISGGGRCNVTHDGVDAADFNGPRPAIRNVLAGFDAGATRRWFAALGVPLKREEGGKLFPQSNQARTVLEALLRRCDRLGVQVRTSCRVEAIETGAPGGPWVVRHGGGRTTAHCVILATGGRSLPRTGSDGSGWELARRLGHSVTATHPALVPLVLAGHFFHAELAGISHEVELTLFVGGRVADRRRGSLLWTHFGISGPAVLDASRHWVLAHAGGDTAELRCSFFADESFAAVEQLLVAAAQSRPRAAVRTVLAAHVPERLAAALVVAAGLDPQTKIGALTRAQRRALAHTLTALPLPVERARGWNFAEVTAGGVPLSEVDYRTMESRRAPRVYLAGEMLDCDGRIGGYNFQWAWSTGHLAGRAAARAALVAATPLPAREQPSPAALRDVAT